MIEDKIVIWALGDIIHRQIDMFGGEDIHKKSKIEYNVGSYPFIPKQVESVIRQFLVLKSNLCDIPQWSGHKTKKPKFLDAGCGIGNILVFAKSIELLEDRKSIYCGLEYFDHTIKAAKRYLKTYPYDNIKIRKADILTYKSYDQYDIIYYYCPFCNKKKEKLFEKRVEDQMKTGAILIPCFKVDRNIDEDKRFKELKLGNQFMYIKV